MDAWRSGWTGPPFTRPRVGSRTTPAPWAPAGLLTSSIARTEQCGTWWRRHRSRRSGRRCTARSTGPAGSTTCSSIPGSMCSRPRSRSYTRPGRSAFISESEPRPSISTGRCHQSRWWRVSRRRTRSSGTTGWSRSASSVRRRQPGSSCESRPVGPDGSGLSRSTDATCRPAAGRTSNGPGPSGSSPCRPPSASRAVRVSGSSVANGRSDTFAPSGSRWPGVSGCSR